MQIESKLKKSSLDDKRNLSDEKQHMAIELANLEVEVKKKMQRADLGLKENKMIREAL